MRILSILSLFGFLLLATNTHADDVDIRIDIVVPVDVVLPDHVVAPDDILIQVELIENDHYAIVQDHFGEVIWRQLVDLPDSLQGSALVDLNAGLADASVPSDSCQSVEYDRTETWTEGNVLVTRIYYKVYDKDGNEIDEFYFEFRTEIEIWDPNAAK